jgi:hypothetical protein
MKRCLFVLIAALSTAACGTSTITKAPHVASLAACRSTRDAALSASNVAYTTTGAYPTTFTALTTGTSPLLIPGDRTTVAGTTITGPGWKLTMTGGGTTPPKLVCVDTPIG